MPAVLPDGCSGTGQQHDHRAGGADNNGVCEDANHLYNALRGGMRGGMRPLRRAFGVVFPIPASLENIPAENPAVRAAKRCNPTRLKPLRASRTRFENGDDDVRHLVNMYRAYHHAGGHPQQRHQRNQPLHQAGNPFGRSQWSTRVRRGKRAAVSHSGQLRQSAARGRRICLNGIENKAIGNQQKDREQNAHPAHSQPASHMPRAGPPRTTFAVFLCESCASVYIQQRRAMADNRRHPHPEYRAPGPTHNADRQRDTGHFTAADARQG